MEIDEQRFQREREEAADKIHHQLGIEYVRVGPVTNRLRFRKRHGRTWREYRYDDVKAQWIREDDDSS